MRSTSSLRSPAALTRYLVASGPEGVCTRNPPSGRRSKPVTGRRRWSSQPRSTASVAYASAGVKGQTIPPSGTSRAPVNHRGNPGGRLVVQGEEGAPPGLGGDPRQWRVVAQQLVAAAHQPRLE